nr:WYL domain-containing protein [Thauera sp.]
MALHKDRIDRLAQLDASRLRILSDSQRLQPAAIRDGVLADVLEALTRGQTLVIGYRDAADKLTRPIIHPQALLQRGPRVYLFALKNGEAQVRKYALHRITSSALGGEPARQAADFDLDREIRRGNADFGDGTLIGVVLRARLRRQPAARVQPERGPAHRGRGRRQRLRAARQCHRAGDRAAAALAARLRRQAAGDRARGAARGDGGADGKDRATLRGR